MAADGTARLLPPARAEFLDAVERYESAHEGLGIRFIAAVERALAIIASAAERWPLAPGVAPARGVRRYLTARFPFAIYYRIVEGDVVEVVAVAHTKRRPGYWARRVP